MISDDTQTVGEWITCLVTFWWHPTLGHSLGHDIFVGDNHDILRIYLARGLFWLSVGSKRARKHAHFVSWNHSHAPHISHDHRDDHRLKMSRPSDRPRVGCTQCHQACDGCTNCLRLASDHHSRARGADMILFQQEFVMTMSVTFCQTDHSKKKSWHSDWPSDDPKHVMSMYWSYQSFWVSPLVITIEYVTLIWILFQSDFLWHVCDFLWNTDSNHQFNSPKYT